MNFFQMLKCINSGTIWEDKQIRAACELWGLTPDTAFLDVSSLKVPANFSAAGTRVGVMAAEEPETDPSKW